MSEDIRSLCFCGEPLIPDRDSYSLPLANGNVYTDLPGGPVRVRTNTRNNSVNITCQYTLSAPQSSYFADMYYGVLREGALPIRVRLELTANDLLDETWYVATIIDAQFPQYTGIVNTVSVTYNAVPQIDRCVSEARAVMYEVFGGYPEILNTCLNPLTVFIKQYVETGRYWIPLSSNLKKYKEVEDSHGGKTFKEDGSVSFSRSTTATYRVGTETKTAQIDEPRFQRGSFLIEGFSTNLFLNSKGFSSFDFANGFSQLDLGGGEVEVTAESALSNATLGIYGPSVGKTGQVFTRSFLLKCSESLSSSISMTVSEVGSGSDVLPLQYSKKKIADGLYFMSATFSAPNVNSFRVRVSSIQAGESFSVSENQIENGYTSTSYIPTSGTATTRGTDNVGTIEGVIPYQGVGFSLSVSVLVDWTSYQGNENRSVLAIGGKSCWLRTANNNNTMQFVYNNENDETKYLPINLSDFSGDKEDEIEIAFDSKTSVVSLSLNGVKKSEFSGGIKYDNTNLYLTLDSIGGGLALNSTISNIKVERQQ